MGWGTRYEVRAGSMTETHANRFARSRALLLFFLLSSLFSAFLPSALFGQAEYYHPELEWRTIETEHFLVHYHQGADRTARTVAKIAEDVYAPITSLYGHKPDQKVSLIIKDYDDLSNGGAYYYDNKIEILAPNLDFIFRGTHNWLRDVVSHEFTHIVQMQTAMKFGRHVPAVYLQWLGYESERRPDVLYGYPNIIASYPIAGTVVPVWFAEGVAQYNRKEFRYDFWDSHRDMILRSYALDGSMLNWEQMAVFGKTSLGNESSYNAGFSLVSYIGNTYGEEKLKEISENLAALPRVSIDGAIQKALGKSGADLYAEWKSALVRSYTERIAPVRAHLQEGKPVAFVDDEKDLAPAGNYLMASREPGVSRMLEMSPCCRGAVETGFANLYPRYSPDGKKLAFVSAAGSDFLGGSSLYVLDFATRKVKAIRTGVGSAMSWSPDGGKLYYARLSHENPHGSNVNDLYVYDLAKESEDRLTHGKRFLSPAVSPDGRTIVCVTDSDGTTNLVTLGIDGTSMKPLTTYAQGEQVYNPVWSPDGQHILFDYSIKDGRDVAWIRPDGTGLQVLVAGPDDARSGAFTPDGSHIVFSSDRTGIFNLYRYDIATGAIDQISNVVGGAFVPAVGPRGEIVYSAYTSKGYKLYEIDQPAVLANAASASYLPAALATDPGASGPLASAAPVAQAPQFDWNALRSYDDTSVPVPESKPYKSIFSSLSVVPFLRVDNYNPHSTGLDVLKPGVYLYSNDVLDRTGFFGGAAMNARLERDIFFQFFYRGKIPLLYQLGLEPAASLEFYDISRDAGNSYISLPDRPPVPVDVSYHLMEFDAAFNHPLFSDADDLEFRYAHSRYTSILGSFINDKTTPPTLVPASSDLYLIANTLAFRYELDAIRPSSTSEINPVGRKITIRLSEELNKFGATDSSGFREYQLTDLGFQPVYDRINFTRLEVGWKEHLPFFFTNHTLSLSFQGSMIFAPPVDDFFDSYIGGLAGMRGYPFYSMGGNRTASVALEYRFPIMDDMGFRILQISFDKLYASFFTDAGNAWTRENPRLRELKTDAGFEIRLQSFSFYSYPTMIFFSGAYGFTHFDRFVRTANAVVPYGGEWRFYFGVLFGFDFN